jgi:hypothetical protein
MGVIFNFVMIQLGPIINMPSWNEAFIHYTPDIETGMMQYISGITPGPNSLLEKGWYYTGVLGC